MNEPNELDSSPFYIECFVCGPNGSFHLAIESPEDLRRCKNDPWGFISSRLGVARETLVEYVENDTRVRCCAATRKGRRCKVTGATWGNWQQWLEHARAEWKCATHV
jgi:hypothetical protein